MNAVEQKQKPAAGAAVIYDDFGHRQQDGRRYAVKIARDFADMAMAVSIRASAYFTDGEHLYAKHFDGNDFSATHLIGFIDGEPVATLRIRYFADFARVERLAVRPTHRRSRIAFQIVRAAFAFCRDKGYRKLSGVAREEMVPFWSMFGGAVSRSADPIVIYGLPHFEMFVEFPALPTAVGAASHPLVLLRPEGRWHEAGYHETGAAPAAISAAMPPPAGAKRPADVAARLSAQARSGDRGPSAPPAARGRGAPRIGRGEGRPEA